MQEGLEDPEKAGKDGGEGAKPADDGAGGTGAAEGVELQSVPAADNDKQEAGGAKPEEIAIDQKSSNPTI